ncbi:MAG TPA: TIGR04283 family arsenosugar biosynthesis glycosyltransferase [Thermomicrobiaceae bacterium]|nr:TIGR04283 family arsenosugar biosynthesis glycosyltransferase [Thermomicrobiaceae bacterium]
MGPAISVIVPAYNEAAVIAATLARVQQVLSPHELMVVDAGGDATAEIAGRYARVLRSSATRGAALNQAAKQATGEVLLFLHADTLLPGDAAAAIAAVLADPGVVAGAFQLRLDDPSRAARLVAAGVNLRSRLLKSFYGDQAMFVRRAAFLRAGGFRDWSVMEDLEILGRLRRQGKLVIVAAAVTTSARRHRQQGWLRTVALIWVISLLFRLGIPAERLARLYRPRR